MVGEALPGHRVAPRENGVARNVVEAAPHDEQRVGEHVVHLIGRQSTPEVALERLEHVGDEHLEAVSGVGVG